MGFRVLEGGIFMRRCYIYIFRFRFEFRDKAGFLAWVFWLYRRMFIKNSFFYIKIGFKVGIFFNVI